MEQYIEMPSSLMSRGWICWRWSQRRELPLGCWTFYV